MYKLISIDLQESLLKIKKGEFLNVTNQIKSHRK